MTEWKDILDEEKLSFAETKRYDTKEDCKDILDKINGNKKLKGIQLSGNTYSVEACEVIAEALGSQSGIEFADLSDMFTTRLKTDVPVSLENFARVFRSTSTLKTLDVSHNALGGPGTKALIPLIALPSLTILRLENCGLGTAGALHITDFIRKLSSAPILTSEEAKIEDLKELLQERASDPEHPNAINEEIIEPIEEIPLKSLVLGRNRLKIDGAEALSLGLSYLKNLEEIHLNSNSIPQIGLVSLFKALHDCPKLRVLNVNDNTLKSDGAKDLVNLIEKLPELRYLDAGDCSLEEEGSLEVVKALRNSVPLLEHLNLSYNDLDDEAAVLLAEVLKSKPNFRTLELNGNAIRSSGLAAIKETLDSLGSLDGLGSMSDNEGSDSDDDDDSNDDSGSD